MQNPDPASLAFITMGDPESPEGIPLGKRGMILYFCTSVVISKIELR